MTLEELINHCERRIPFKVIRNVLKEKKLSTFQGWENTKNNYIRECERSQTFYDKVFNAFKQIYKQHILSGEKVVRIFKVDSLILQQFLDNFDDEQHIETDSVYVKDYPFPTSDISETDDSLALIHTNRKENVLRLGFCSSRRIEEHIKLNITDFDRKTKTTYFNGFQELYGTKNYRKQLFDFIFINVDSGYIELRIDSASNLSVKDQDKSILLLKRKLIALLKDTLSDKVALIEQNLYPKIQELYNSEEGRVCELAFSVSTGAVMHEKMRSKDVDIRNEDFHCGGMEAVDRIDAYKIAIEWDSPVPNDDSFYKFELMLNSSLRESYEAKPSLYDAHIFKCANVVQYNKLLNKLL